MIYGGDIMSNFSGSMMSNDKEMTKDILISEIHKILHKNPKSLIEALKNSGVDVPSRISNNHLVHLVVEAVYENAKFRENVAYLITENNHSNFSNANGELLEKFKSWFANKGEGSDSTETAGEAVGKVLGGASSGGVVGAVAGAVNSIFGFAKSKSDAKAQKEADKQKLLLSLSEDKKKSNLVPIIIIASVLLIGGAIAFVSLRNKN
jgi:hypothetical protein